MDRTPPTIVGHWPGSEQTEVPVDSEIFVEFSEKMDRRFTGSAIFVAPRTSLRLKWRGHRLEAHIGRLQPAQTYVVTVGADARDMRGNLLGASYSFAFATGTGLDRRGLKGTVFEEGRPVSAASVWIHDLRHFNGKLGSDLPDYETRTSREGKFEFTHLSPGRFLVIAFRDENRNLKRDSNEARALPPKIYDLSHHEEVQIVDLLMEYSPREVSRLNRVQALDKTKLLLEFNRKVKPENVIVEINDLPIVAKYQTLKDAKRLYVITTDQKGGVRYHFEKLVVDGLTVEWNESWRSSERKDRKPPSVEAVFPSGVCTRSDSITILFDEAMDTTRIPGLHFWKQSDSLDALDGIWKWETSTRLVLIPSEEFDLGIYSLQGQLGQLADRAGLAPTDPLVELNFQVTDFKDLPVVSGIVTARGLSTKGKILVTAQNLTDAKIFRTSPDSTGAYELSQMLPGKYSIMAFIDQNNNFAPDVGAFEPLTLAETVSIRPETVILDVNQNVANIDFELR